MKPLERSLQVVLFMLLLTPVCAGLKPRVFNSLSSDKIFWDGQVTNTVKISVKGIFSGYLEYPPDPMMYGLEALHTKMKTLYGKGRTTFVLQYVFRPKFAGTIKIKPFTLKIINLDSGITNPVYTPVSTIEIVKPNNNIFIYIILAVAVFSAVFGFVLIKKHSNNKK